MARDFAPGKEDFQETVAGVRERVREGCVRLTQAEQQTALEHSQLSDACASGKSASSRWRSVTSIDH